MDYGWIDPAAVRAALDVGLTAAKLPDEVIYLPLYADAAQAEVVQRDPDAATRTGDALAHVLNAANYLCAARIAPALPAIVRKQLGDVTIQAQPIDRAAQAAALRVRAGAELDAVLATDTAVTALRPVAFALACGSRGRLLGRLPVWG